MLSLIYFIHHFCRYLENRWIRHKYKQGDKFYYCICPGESNNENKEQWICNTMSWNLLDILMDGIPSGTKTGVRDESCGMNFYGYVESDVIYWGKKWGNSSLRNYLRKIKSPLHLIILRYLRLSGGSA